MEQDYYGTSAHQYSDYHNGQELFSLRIFKGLLLLKIISINGHLHDIPVPIKDEVGGIFLLCGSLCKHHLGVSRGRPPNEKAGKLQFCLRRTIQDLDEGKKSIESLAIRL